MRNYLAHLDALPPREAAVAAWFDHHLITYAIDRLSQCEAPSPSTAAVLKAYGKVDDIRSDASIRDAIRCLADLRHEVVTERKFYEGVYGRPKPDYVP
jgi:hypothetical protein